MSRRDPGSHDHEARRKSIGRMVLLGFLAGGGFGFLITLIYIFLR